MSPEQQAEMILHGYPAHQLHPHIREILKANIATVLMIKQAELDEAIEALRPFADHTRFIVSGQPLDESIRLMNASRQAAAIVARHEAGKEGGK